MAQKWWTAIWLPRRLWPRNAKGKTVCLAGPIDGHCPVFEDIYQQMKHKGTKVTTRFATFTADGQQHYGIVANGGIIAVSAQFPQWPTLREVIAADGLGILAQAAAGRGVTHPDGAFRWDIPIPAPEKIICVGVNFPDRNAEYKDGQDAPTHMT